MFRFRSPACSAWRKSFSSFQPMISPFLGKRYKVRSNGKRGKKCHLRLITVSDDDDEFKGQKCKSKWFNWPKEWTKDQKSYKERLAHLFDAHKGVTVVLIVCVISCANRKMSVGCIVQIFVRSARHGLGLPWMENTFCTWKYMFGSNPICIKHRR